MNTIIRRSLLTLVSSAFALAPNSVIAGGGGAATKTNTNVRIKNMSAARCKHAAACNRER